MDFHWKLKRKIHEAIGESCVEWAKFELSVVMFYGKSYS